MAYTVKQLAAVSGVSVRTLHFYDETGLLKPARYGANGYRFYEEPQLLRLQQILSYRELGFELKQIQQILDRPDFEVATALKSHRELLREELARKRTLVETIEKTITHLEGEKTMSAEEMFAGFSVAAGKDRFDEQIKLGGEPHDCKVSARDTAGAICVFEFTGTGGGPRHRHPAQDEWIYVLDGEFEFEIGGQRLRAGAGESVFLPRNVVHDWVSVTGRPGKILDVYQPAGKMEEFFREVGKYARDGGPLIHEAITLPQMHKLFADHGIDLTGPPMAGEWKVEEDGRIVRLA